MKEVLERPGMITNIKKDTGQKISYYKSYKSNNIKIQLYEIRNYYKITNLLF